VEEPCLSDSSVFFNKSIFHTLNQSISVSRHKSAYIKSDESCTDSRIGSLSVLKSLQDASDHTLSHVLTSRDLNAQGEQGSSKNLNFLQR